SDATSTPIRREVVGPHHHSLTNSGIPSTKKWCSWMCLQWYMCPHRVTRVFMLPVHITLTRTPPLSCSYFRAICFETFRHCVSLFRMVAGRCRITGVVIADSLIC